MKQKSTLVFAVVLLIFSHRTSISAQEVEDEREFDYIEGSEKGPRHWGEIKKDWADCKSGNLQSPIDMSDPRVKLVLRSMQLKSNYKPNNATIMNRGHDIMVKWEGENAGSIQINGSEYFLQQCHWHSPSEHTINGRRYDMELHMVHISSDPNVKNKIAVVGILYKIGQPDDFLSKLLGDIMSMSDKKLERQKGMIDPNEISNKMESKKKYRYMGSLTTPPCTQGVIWNLNKKISTVSRDQVKVLREAVHDYAANNSRPTQSLNRREIHLYGANRADASNND